MSGNHNMNLYGDGTVFRGERSADSEVPTIDWQSTCEMWKAAHEKADRIANELQDTVHKQAHEIERLRYLIEKTYYIHPETGNLHQVLMDNLLADVARDILESMK